MFKKSVKSILVNRVPYYRQYNHNYDQQAQDVPFRNQRQCFSSSVQLDNRHEHECRKFILEISI